MNVSRIGLPLLLLTAAIANAATLEGVTLPDTATAGGQTLVLNGVGLRSKMMIKVYVAGLYLPAKSTDAAAVVKADEPKRMTLKFLRGVSRDQMVEAYTDGFAANAPDASKNLSEEIDQLMKTFVPMKEGDQMDFTYLPGKGTTLAINGQDKATIPGLPFAQAMFACWIGPKPPSVDFKAGVMGK